MTDVRFVLVITNQWVDNAMDRLDVMFIAICWPDISTSRSFLLVIVDSRHYFPQEK